MAEKVKAHQLWNYRSEPQCPRCNYVGFDDWWHVLRDRKGGAPRGKLICGSCDKLFFIEGVPGSVRSSAFGLSVFDLEMRRLGM